MRTWSAAQRRLRREAGRALTRRDARIPPLVVAVGAGEPHAVIALRGVDPDRPSRTVAELVVLAAAFRPDRVLVGRAVSTAPADRRGVLVVHDLQMVADGLVEMSRAWAWSRLAGRVTWLPAQVRRWQVIDPFVTEVARAVIDERPAHADPVLLQVLLARSAAAGHDVRLAPPR